VDYTLQRIFSIACVARTTCRAIAQEQSPETVDDLYVAVTGLACHFKLWGFVEEKEVRVIAIPAGKIGGKIEKSGSDSD
jgi:hypothetical protein